MASGKKIFLGCFWLLLILGTCQLILDAVTVHTYYRWSSITHSAGTLGRINLFRLFLWPTVVLAESLVYWLIRRRNRYHALSWAHGGIFLAAFLLNALLSVLRQSPRIVHDVNRRIEYQIERQEQQYFFWGLVAIAHLAFFAVLANCARKEVAADEAAEGASGTVNLLDDIEL